MTRQQKIVSIAIGLIIVGGLGWIFVGQTPVDAGAQAARSPSNDDDRMSRFQIKDWEVAIVTNPYTPMVGDNALIVDIRDAHGNAATGVAIEAYAEMPAMGAMSPMRAPVGRLQESAPGRYEGTMNLSMRGEWPLTVSIQDHPVLGNRRLHFDLATDRPGLSIASGATPVGAQVASSEDDNTFFIDSRRRQLIGLKTEEATHRDLVKPIRAVGLVTYDERLLSQVSLKYDGYIGELNANYVGAEIAKGQVLFTVYSPDLLAAQQEYLETLKRRGSRDGGDSLLRAARQRLALWDMTETEITALEQRGSAREYVPIHAPRSGTLIERHISEGSGARAGHPLLTIADLSRVWIEADIYEGDLALISVDTPAAITLPYLPGQRFTANVEYIYPYLQGVTRTGRVRLTIDNDSGTLKPNMYADVALKVALGHRLSVPEQAVIVAGSSRIVFVDLGGGQLKPVHVTTGHRVQGYVEIRDGLALGDVVVTSGNFLVAAEARLKMGIQQW